MTRLLGQNHELVLHGGGNTSVKTKVANYFGDLEDTIYIKGSGFDMETIDEMGFAPVRLDTLLRMADLVALSDRAMVNLIRTSLLSYDAPNASLEAILHAVLPFRYVCHTHADAVVTLTNNANCRSFMETIYGTKVMVIPYYMPGFELSKAVFEVLKEKDPSTYEGIILENHGVVTYADDAKTAYENMIALSRQAEAFLRDQGAYEAPALEKARSDLEKLAEIRLAVSRARGRAVVALSDQSPQACGFSILGNVAEIAGRGCITPDHAIHMKPFPAIIHEDVVSSLEDFAGRYNRYFERNDRGKALCLDPAPRWAVWPGYGTLSFGPSMEQAEKVFHIAQRTIIAMQWGEALGGWRPISEKHLFDMEYWDLQQIKLAKDAEAPEFQGKIVLVTGAAGGIGLSCAQAFHARGAAVIGVDLDPKVEVLLNGSDELGLVCDVTDYGEMERVVHETVRRFGGLDILILNAGVFPPSAPIEDMDPVVWNRSMEINLTSQQRLLQMTIPYLKIRHRSSRCCHCVEERASPGSRCCGLFGGQSRVGSAGSGGRLGARYPWYSYQYVSS